MTACGKVVWSEGLFLRPQHFQQMERYVEHYVDLRVSAGSEPGWGFDDIDIDVDLLAMGRLCLRRARGVFPDGTPFAMPDHDPLPLPLAVDATWQGRTVHLALPLRRPGQPDVAWQDSDPSSRFAVGEVELSDSSGSSRESASLQVGRLRATLIGDDRPHDGWVTLPLARIVDGRAHGQVALDAGFIPCVRAHAASSRLVRIVAELLGLLGQRGDELASRCIEDRPIDTDSLRDTLRLQAINGWQPRLAHVASQPSFHPEALWRVLLGMAGELATFTSPGRRPPMFPAYDHMHPRACFDGIADALRSCLRTMLADAAIEVPLRDRGQGTWIGALHEAMKVGCTSFVLAVTCDLDATELRRRLPAQAKIGPADRIRDLVNLQLPGIAIEAVDVAPRGVAGQAGWQHFVIDTGSPLWKSVQASRVLALHVGDGFGGLAWRLWASKDRDR